MLGLDFAVTGLKKIYHWARGTSAQPAPVLQQSVNSARSETTGSSSKPSISKTRRFLTVVMHLEAGIDALAVMNAFVRPFTAILAPSLGYYTLGVAGAIVGSEYVFRCVLTLVRDDGRTEIYRFASNPALTAGKTAVSLVQIASNVNPGSLAAIATATAIGVIPFGGRQLLQEVDNTQIQPMLAINPVDNQPGCTPATAAKAGHVIDRALETATAGITLGNAAAGIIKIVSEGVGLADAQTLAITTGTLVPLFIAGTTLSIFIYKGTLNPEHTTSHKAGKALVIIDGILHDVPLKALLLFAFMLEVYIASVTSSAAQVAIPNWYLALAASLSILRAVGSGVIAGLRSLSNYVHWTKHNQEQRLVDDRALVLRSDHEMALRQLPSLDATTQTLLDADLSRVDVATANTCFAALSAFFAGAERRVTRSELIEYHVVQDAGQHTGSYVPPVAAGNSMLPIDYDTLAKIII
jgi:hypothetical protein